MYCNATAVLKIDSVYKQGKNYHPQVYVEECKYTDAENQQCNMFIDDDGFLDVWTGVRCRVPKGNNLFNAGNGFFL